MPFFFLPISGQNKARQKIVEQKREIAIKGRGKKGEIELSIVSQVKIQQD